MNTYKLIGALGLAATISVGSLAQDNTYYIGHSGFGFSEFNLVGHMVDDLAQDAGINTYDYGDQIIGGRCLSYQWENPGDTHTGNSMVDIPAGNGSGLYDNLVVTELIPISEAFDPSAHLWDCNLDPYTALDNFHDLALGANPNTAIYLMEFHNEADFTIGGETTVYNDWANLNSSNRLLWEELADSVSEANGGTQICIIPVAAATQALADSVMDGNFPGITNFIDIFEPTDGMSWKIHFTDITTYLSACVHFATLFNQSPVGLTHELAGRTVAAGTAPTPAQALIMQQIAWSIVTNDPRSCVSMAPTNIKEIDQERKIVESYQNPVSNRASIYLVHAHTRVHVEVRNVAGQLVASQKFNNVNKFEIPMEGQKQGVYLLKIVGDRDTTQTVKIIKAIE